jgi:hypothetical protein
MTPEFRAGLEKCYNELNAIEERAWAGSIRLMAAFGELSEFGQGVIAAVFTWPEEKARTFFAEWEAAEKAGKMNELRERWLPDLLASLDDDE